MSARRSTGFEKHKGRQRRDKNKQRPLVFICFQCFSVSSAMSRLPCMHVLEKLGRLFEKLGRVYNTSHLFGQVALFVVLTFEYGVATSGASTKCPYFNPKPLRPLPIRTNLEHDLLPAPWRKGRSLVAKATTYLPCTGSGNFPER